MRFPKELFFAWMAVVSPLLGQEPSPETAPAAEPLRALDVPAARLRFAISLAFDFDVYISDEATAAGDATFRARAAAEFRRRASQASVVMVSHDPGTLRRFCTAGMLLHAGKLTWFDHLGDAVKAYTDTIRDTLPK